MSVDWVMRPDSSSSLGMYTIVPAGQEHNSLRHSRVKLTHRQSRVKLISTQNAQPPVPHRAAEMPRPNSWHAQQQLPATTRLSPRNTVHRWCRQQSQVRTVCGGADVCGIKVQHPAQPKICDLAHEAAHVLGAALEQHVCCLEVAVHHADGVQVVQA